MDENKDFIIKSPGIGNYPLNKTMLETAKGKYGKQWRFIGLTFLIYMACLTIFQLLMNQFFGKEFAEGSIISVLGGYVLSALICVPFIVNVGKRSRSSLGIQNENIAKNEISGWIFAGIALLSVWVINQLLGGLNVTLNNKINLMMLLFMFIGFLLQGFMEEFLLRSLIMTQISLRLGVLIGILGNSLFFAVGHATNQGASTLSVLNTFIIGVVFSLMYYYHDNLWLVAGFHSGWNFILGPVLGITVSGFKLPTSIFESVSVQGKELLNGGEYGFEASIPVTILSLLIGLIYIVIINKKNKKYNFENK